MEPSLTPLENLREREKQMNAPEMKDQMMEYLLNLGLPLSDAEECLRLFLSTFSDCVTHIRSGLAQRDIPQIRAASHTLAGSAGTISASEIERIVRELNTFAKASDFAHAEECFRILSAIYDSLRLLVPPISSSSAAPAAGQCTESIEKHGDL